MTSKSQNENTVAIQVDASDIEISNTRPRTTIYRAPEAGRPTHAHERTSKTSHCPDNWGSE